MHSRPRLIRKIAPFYLLIVILTTVVLAQYAGTIVRQAYIDRSFVELENKVNLLTLLIEPALAGPPEQIQAACLRLGETGGVRLTVMMPDGMVVGDSKATPQTMEYHANRDEMAAALKGRIGRDVRRSVTTHAMTAYVAKPLMRDDKVVAVVRVGLELTELSEVLSAVYVRMTVAGGLALIVIGMVAMYVFQRYISRPLQRLQTRAEQFGAGNLTELVPQSKSDAAEFATLADVLNAMARQLDEKMRTVTQQAHEQQAVLAGMIEGVIAVVDMNARKVLRLIDTGVVPVPQATADVDEASVGKLRIAPKPLQIVQPNGGSFEIRGNEIRWQNWRFRYALHPREGLVLYTVGYEDGGKVRPILYRASLSEMVVPYGDPSAGWFIRNAFDEGEFAIGRLAVPQEAKTDLPDNATLLDAVFSNEGGGSLDAKRVISIYERDGGVSWKHVDYMTNQNQSRRARQLVMSIFVVVGNYDYGFNWVFHQDGTLELEALLTGVMATKGVSPDAQQKHDPYGHVVANGVAAPHHQHFFNFRLDFDVDGHANTVVEQNTETLPPGKDNPYGNAFVMHETPLRREAEAQRKLNLATHRRWRVINPTVKNSLGQPTGYLLFTGENSVPLPGEASAVRQRAGFMNSHLWVTQYEPEERYAAGFYINQSKGGDGLPRWVKQNRELENKDVVLWYSFGVTHLPRPEDYPVMPVHKTGFKLMPVGFFAQNPALDLPK